MDNAEEGALDQPRSFYTLVAEALKSMSMDARSTVLEELHGVAPLPPEEGAQDLIKDCLHRMGLALDAIPKKPAFEEAQTYSASFVHDVAYHLAFLRANNFNPQKAAICMVEKLELLSSYFGPFALQRQIMFRDLSREAQSLVKDGSLQLLPTRDQSGRMIVMRIGTFGSTVSSQTRLRALLYLAQYCSDDIESQKKGLVIVVFATSNFDTTTFNDPDGMRDLRSVFVTAAVRPTAIHICLSDATWEHIIGTLMRVLFPPKLGVRVRIHIGSVTECQYKLMGYGIPGDQLPITSSERIKTLNHLRWIKYCTAKEAAIMNQSPTQQQHIFAGIFCPLPLDVIAGRGPHINNHPGNIRYRELLESMLEMYDNANGAEEKIQITLTVVMTITEEGGRFLAKDPECDWWVPITNQEEARLKVSAGFRDIRKLVKARSSRKKAKNETGNLTGLVNSVNTPRLSYENSTIVGAKNSCLPRSSCLG